MQTLSRVSCEGGRYSTTYELIRFERLLTGPSENEHNANFSGTLRELQIDRLNLRYVA